MLGRHRTRRSAPAAAIAAALTLTLAGCGSSDDSREGGSDALAASVDGREITVGEVQRTTRELGEVLSAQASSSGQPAQTIGTDEVLVLLVQVPGVLEFGAEQDIDVPSAGSVRKDLSQVLPAPSEATVDFFRANSLNSQLDDSTRQELTAHLSEQDVTISPRYAGATGGSPDWLEAPVEEQLPMGTP